MKKQYLMSLWQVSMSVTMWRKIKNWSHPIVWSSCLGWGTRIFLCRSWDSWKVFKTRQDKMAFLPLYLTSSMFSFLLFLSSTSSFTVLPSSPPLLTQLCSAPADFTLDLGSFKCTGRTYLSLSAPSLFCPSWWLVRASFPCSPLSLSVLFCFGLNRSPQSPA